MLKVVAVLCLVLLIPMFTYGQSSARKHIFDPTIAATFVSDVTLPDGTVMISGQSFTKTWRIRNSGSKPWNGYHLAFVDGAKMNAPTTISVPTTQPGETVDINISMTAPMDVGSHRGNWQMQTANGEFFGPGFFVVVQVESSTYESRTYEDWVADLNSDLPAVREKAVIALSRFGPIATTDLIKTFQSDPAEKIRAIALVGLLENKPLSNEAFRVVMDTITDPDPTINATTIMFLQEVLPMTIGPENVSVLIEATHDSTSAIRRQLAVKLLAHIGPEAKEAVSTLRELSHHDPEPVIRHFASKALEYMDQRGTVSGNVYSSSRNWFSVNLPKSSNMANIPFSIKDTSVSLPNVDNYDLVTFEVKDFGEVLIACVGSIPNNVTDIIKETDDQTLLSNLANKALDDWRDFPIEPKVVEESFLTTSHGKSLLRFYKAENGSLLMRSSGSDTISLSNFDTSIAVIVAKNNNHFVYAIAENDIESSAMDKKNDVLKRRLQSFFDNIIVTR